MAREDPSERLAFYRPVALPGIELMAAYASSQPWHMFHERFAFGACVSAEAGVRYRGIDDVVRDRRVVVREPGETHYNTFVAKPAHFKLLFVEPERVAEAAREMGLPRGLHFPPAVIDDASLFETLCRLCAGVEASGGELELQCLFAAAIAALGAHAERGARPPPPPRHASRAVARARAHLRERFNEPVSLEQLAGVSGLSRFHLVHTFTREVGLSPHAYQVHIRIERACTLLRAGMPPVVAAASTGFADQSHFTRHFKRIMRVTPIDYARANRRSPCESLSIASPS